MINNIIYDFGYVLAYPRSGNWFIPPNSLKIIGLQNLMKILLHTKKFKFAFRSAYEVLNADHLLHTEEIEYSQFTRYYKQILAETGIVKDADKLAGLLAQDTVYNDHKVVFYEDVLDELKKAKTTYHISVLSDTWPSLQRLFDHKGITPLLEGLIMSCDYGICKDKIELFHIAISKLGIEPEETMFIDDSRSNLDNAKAAGLIPVLMDRKGKVKQSSYPVVHNLSEVFRLAESYNK